MSFDLVWRKCGARPRAARPLANRRLNLEPLEDRDLPAPVAPVAGPAVGANPGHLVEIRQSTTPIANIGDADALLAPGATNVKFTALDNGISVINYADKAVNTSPPLSGDFGNDKDIRSIVGAGFGTGPQENYAIHASGFIQIPTAGAWTFTVNSDDGFRLTMGAGGTVIAQFPDQKTPSNISGVADVPQPGLYPYDLVYFQAVASPDTSSEVEFSASGPGQPTNLLVGDSAGALKVFQGLQGLTVSASGPTTVVAGDNLTYAISVVNNGPNVAQNLKLTLPVPANTTVVSATQTAGPALTLTTPPVGSTGTITATSTSFAVGMPATLSVVVRVSPAVTTGTVISTTATATSDGTTDIRTATVTTSVIAATGATTPNGHFVIQLYRDLLELPLFPGQTLSRSEAGIAQDPGVQDRINALDAGTMTRSQVVFSVINGTEYRTRAIDALYLKDLGRPAEQFGLDNWLAFINQGGNLRGVEAAIFSSPEFFARNGSTNIGFLQGAYRNATGGQTIPPELLAAYLDTLSKGFTRLVVTRQIVITLAAHDQTVTHLYAEFLRRLADAGGRTAFDNALQAGASDEQVLVAITASAEYFQFAQTQTGFQP